MFKHLQKGNSTENPAIWKNVAVLTSLLTILLKLIEPIFPGLAHMNPEDLTSVILAINAYVHVATSDKVGV